MDTAAFIDEVAHRLVEYISSDDGPGRVNPAASLESMRRTLDVQLPLQGHGLDAVLDDLDTFIVNSVKTHRPEFMNPLWGGLSLPAFAGEVVASLTNNSMYTLRTFTAGHLDRANHHPAHVANGWLPRRLWNVHHRWLQWQHVGHAVCEGAPALRLDEARFRRAVNGDLRLC